MRLTSWTHYLRTCFKSSNARLLTTPLPRRAIQTGVWTLENLEDRVLLSFQVLAPSSTSIAAAAGAAVSFDVSYKTQDATGKDVALPSSGLKASTFFDSSKLTFQAPTTILNESLLAVPVVVLDDTKNLDNNPATDKLFNIVWNDLGSKFPTSPQPLRLFTAHFTTSATFSGTTRIGFDGSSPGSGFDLKTTPVTVTANTTNLTPTLDVIGDPAPINLGAGTQTVDLKGITAGGSENQALTVTATSDKPGLIPNPNVTYTSPNSSGSLSYTPVAGQSGTATITVTVRDAGLDGIAKNSDDATTSRTFAVKVNATGVTVTVNVSVAPASVLENAGTNLVYTLTRSGDVTNPLTVNLGVGGTAKHNDDYMAVGSGIAASSGPSSRTATFVAGSTTAIVFIIPEPDVEFEADETVVFTVTSGTGYVIGTTAAATGTIQNDDVATGGNQPPVASSFAFDIAAGGYTNFSQLFASDANGDPLIFEQGSIFPQLGKVLIFENGTFHYNASDIAGLDSFSFKVSDGQSTSQEVLVSVNVLSLVTAVELSGASGTLFVKPSRNKNPPEALDASAHLGNLVSDTSSYTFYPKSPKSMKITAEFSAGAVKGDAFKILASDDGRMKITSSSIKWDGRTVAKIQTTSVTVVDALTGRNVKVKKMTITFTSSIVFAEWVNGGLQSIYASNTKSMNSQREVKFTVSVLNADETSFTSSNSLLVDSQ